MLLSSSQVHTTKSAHAPQSKRLFIKDMAFFLFPAPGREVRLAPSFGHPHPEPKNPTMLPRHELAHFRFTFLIRHPRLSVPSYYRLSLPPHRSLSRVRSFNTNDLGYSELRKLFDYLQSEELIGPSIAVADPLRKDTSQPTSIHGSEICVVDAEDLISRPNAVIEAYCQITGIAYEPEMLHWEGYRDQERAKKVINRWGVDIYFHKAALESKTIQHSSIAEVRLFCPCLDQCSNFR